MTAGPAPADGTVVDLSVPLAEGYPSHWATHMPLQVKVYNWFTERHGAGQSVLDRWGPYATRWLAVDEHSGTHVDAPSHFIPPPDSGLPHCGPAGAVSVDRLDLASLMGAAAVIDAPATQAPTPAGRSPIVGPEAVLAWEARHGRLRPGEIVLLRTGWDRHYRHGVEGDAYCRDVVVTGRSPGWPAPAVETVELLLDRGVRCFGTDGVSVGPAHDAAPVHLLGLGAGMAMIECLTGLAALPARGAWFCFLPLRLVDGTGAPGRAIAILPP